jgi:hypothetical protein
VNSPATTRGGRLRVVLDRHQSVRVGNELLEALEVDARLARPGRHLGDDEGQRRADRAQQPRRLGHQRGGRGLRVEDEHDLVSARLRRARGRLLRS